MLISAVLFYGVRRYHNIFMIVELIEVEDHRVIASGEDGNRNTCPEWHKPPLLTSSLYKKRLSVL